MSVFPSEPSDIVLPTLAYLRECFDYNALTGELTWKVRPREHFPTERGWKAANGRCAGRTLKPRVGHDYIQINLFGRMFVAHRIAYALHHGMDLKDVPENVDHRNGRTSDNRATNLRATTFSNNAKNRVINCNNTSGRKGVSFHRASGRWQMTIQGKHMGLYDTVDEAGDAYEAEAAKRFGDFNRQDPWKRKEVIGACTLYLGDCMDILPFIGSFDAVLTDPPYGIDRASGMGGGGTSGNGRYERKPRRYTGEWDNQRPSADCFKAILSAAHDHIVWGGNYFSDLLPQSSRWLFWDKLNAMPSYSDGEMAWTSLEGNAVKKFTRCNNGMASVRDGERSHPTQKPIDLMVWCMGFMPDAATILDPFMGSGSTGVACAKMGRSFAGIEIDPDYFDAACERIQKAYAQPDMFVAPPAAKAEQLSILDGAL